MSIVGDFTGNVNAVQTTFKWQMDDFCVSCKHPKQHISSPYFFARNMRWQIDLYPKGKEADEGYVSLFLTLYDIIIDKEIDIEFAISIINDKNEKFITHKSGNRKFNLPHQSWGWLQFIKTNQLVDKKNNLLTNDKLVILCEIVSDKTIYVEKEIDENKVKQDKCYQRLENLHNFEKFFNNQKFSDVQLVVNDTVLYAHKNILANQSVVFAAMFQHDMKENRENKVSVNDIDYDVFLELLRFLYTGKINDMEKVAKRLVHAADMYGLKELKDLCAEYFVDSLSVDNVTEYFTLAERYNMKLLQTKAIYFISSHADLIVKVVSER